MKSVKLYELAAEDPTRRFSPYCWRARFACLHKGLNVEGVPMRFNEKDKIKFADSKQVPVLHDGETKMNESFEIAKYLEKTYPDAPSLFGGEGGEAGCYFVNAFADTVMMHYFPFIMSDIWEKLDKGSAEYFRESREKMMGSKLEDLKKGREDKIKTFRDSLAPIRTVLESQPFLGGETANYSDYALASDFLTAKAMTSFPLLEKDDALNAWLDRIYKLFGGKALEGYTFEA